MVIGKVDLKSDFMFFVLELRVCLLMEVGWFEKVCDVYFKVFNVDEM